MSSPVNLTFNSKKFPLRIIPIFVFFSVFFNYPLFTKELTLPDGAVVCDLERVLENYPGIRELAQKTMAEYEKKRRDGSAILYKNLEKSNSNPSNSKEILNHGELIAQFYRNLEKEPVSSEPAIVSKIQAALGRVVERFNQMAKKRRKGRQISLVYNSGRRFSFFEKFKSLHWGGGGKFQNPVKISHLGDYADITPLVIKELGNIK